ncbi:unnamed protein product, partial [Scytosiphon promiscuus]
AAPKAVSGAPSRDDPAVQGSDPKALPAAAADVSPATCSAVASEPSSRSRKVRSGNNTKSLGKSRRVNSKRAAKRDAKIKCKASGGAFANDVLVSAGQGTTWRSSKGETGATSVEEGCCCSSTAGKVQTVWSDDAIKDGVRGLRRPETTEAKTSPKGDTLDASSASHTTASAGEGSETANLWETVAALVATVAVSALAAAAAAEAAAAAVIAAGAAAAVHEREQAVAAERAAAKERALAEEQKAAAAATAA